MKLHKYAKQIKNFLIDILFPIKCIGCNKKDDVLCTFCVSKIRLAERETDKDILGVFDYRDAVIKKAIWELKYHHKRYLGEKLGQLLYEYLIEDIGDMKTYVSGRVIYVIPVPISNKKTKLRGYSQALAIAKGFCHSSPAGTFELQNNIVIKKLETIPQAKISNRKQRLKNVEGIFEIKNKEFVKGRTIIVLDDVTTTGGTINEMMKILRKAGAKRVVGFAVAH